MGGHHGPPPNFVVSSSITIKIGILIEFDKFPPKWPQKVSKMTPLPSYDVIFCLRLQYPLKFRNCLFLDGFYREQSLGADSDSKVIFYIGGQYQANIGHLLQFCL